VIALPPLVDESQRSWLPMSDVAAVSLGEWFLTESSNRSVDTLVEVLQGDPSLAFWVALRADRLSLPPPRSIADLARFVAAYGPAWLQWSADSVVESADVAWVGELSGRLAPAILISQMAAELAAVHGETASRQAGLLGLFQDPAHWRTTLEREFAGQATIRLPSWFVSGVFDPAAVEAMKQALSLLSVASGAAATPALEIGAGVPPASSETPDDSSSRFFVVPAYRSRCREAASRWAATHETARWLKTIMARLARLSFLEGSFREAVESAKMAAMAEFAAGAGHEINNPLAVIAGRAQLLLRDEAEPERRRDLAVINAQAMRVNEMIADLRLFATPPELEPETLDLNGLVRQVVEEIQPLAVAQETTLCFIEGSPGVRIKADPVQLTVAIRALCQNSLEALSGGGRIELSIVSESGKALITVADDGPGIPPEQRPHIFEPFYSARQAGRGVGMGLSKCWRIVTLHGGWIEVGNHAGLGAVFAIRLPLI
jgi:signal transduction histidine kinase